MNITRVREEAKMLWYSSVISWGKTGSLTNGKIKGKRRAKMSWWILVKN